MIKRALATTVMASILVTTPVVAHAADAASSPVPQHYVALGDSYSAGHGTEAHPDMKKCSRTDAAYPSLFAAKYSISDFDFAACQGATTLNIFQDAQTPQHETVTQDQHLSADTDLVTISIGGNDLEANEVGTYCAENELFGGDDDECLRRIQHLTDMAQDKAPLPQTGNTMSEELAKTYDDIRAKAPNAHVVVMGYPDVYQIVPYGGQQVNSFTSTRAIGPASREAFNRTMDALDETIARVAASKGFDFVDPRTDFAGHGASSAQTNYMNGVDEVDSHISFHPNADGHLFGYLPALERDLNLS
ncbi:GDSL-like lipase/acylhydrolase family protein [Microbacterium sp. AG790]|uniref:SGNH/GDSL hydrolase family protein n=1 Tax=Microbacterium sp. AG790 TaxID=2183995 RepID=UPI000EB28AA1|nr:SGNH/GDSL hydrolase family protein [Microbacterium sp. AG790]RKS94399.1 GDSL-like lipase/acylhydrolase family protein [Microbacterium sp. AG790]